MRALSILFVLVFASVAASRSSPAEKQKGIEAAVRQELTQLLRAFLKGAGTNDVALHDRFWAEDLIYTGSGGRRVGKAQIMKEVREAPPPKPDDPKVAFRAEEIRIQRYGTTAVVAFRLVGEETALDGKVQVSNYYNTGTFVKRNGLWQVVAWQATRIPPPVPETTKPDG